MTNVYVVTEDYTNAFIGLFKTKADAEKAAQDVGGEVREYDLTNVETDEEMWNEIIPTA